MSKPISKYLSRKIKFVSVFAMFAIVFVHSYNYNGENLLTEKGVNAAEMFEYFFAKAMFSFAIPMFFIFSGFLLFIKYENTVKGYLDKIQHRIFPLLVPYVLWALLSGLVITILTNFDSIKDIEFIKSNALGFDKFYMHLVKPPAYQLWFLRQVMLFTVLSPILYLLIKYTKAFILIPFGALWVLNIEFIINSEALLFFSIGAAFAIMGKWRNFTKKDNRIPAALFSLLWIALSALQMILASMTKNVLLVNIVSKLTALAGIAGMWLVFDHIVKYISTKKGLLLASAHLFFVFALHEPLLKISYQMAIIPDSTDGSHFILFICLPISVIAVCMILSMVLRKIARPVHNLLTGGRNS
ncbi:MAG: acyltransferase [Ruminococcus sp.]|nr:acyltransferase [Ruminococcus sp.]